MILDSSAIIALFLQEPEYDKIRDKLINDEAIGIGAPTLVETAIVLSARLSRDARGMLARFIEENQVIVIPFTEGHYGVAVTAWQKYGRGRHPAALNFGDCLSYSVAKVAGVPLLFTGGDFRLTDIQSA